MIYQRLKKIIIEHQGFIENVEVIFRDINIDNQANYVFTGPRRSGKTFYMFQLMREFLKKGKSIEDFLYINFEDERLLEFQSCDFDLLLTCYKELFYRDPILFLDEIQNITGWEKFARRMADSGYRIYITGSNASLLSKEIATILGGRYFVKEIFPLSFKEFLYFKNTELAANYEFSSQAIQLKRLFTKYLYIGGFPETGKYESSKEYLSNILQKIFHGDIIARYKIRNEHALKLLIKKIAENIGDETSYNRFKNLISSTGVKVGVSTVIEFIDYLVESYLIHEIENYANKFTERESKKKYYFSDNGILGLYLFKPESQLLENLVFNALKLNLKDSYSYYKTDFKVDFYIPEQKTLIQVSYSLENQKTITREIRALIKAQKILKAETLMLLTMDEEKVIKEGDANIQVLPVWKWLLK